MPTSRLRNETLLNKSAEAELLCGARVWPGSGEGAGSSAEPSLSVLLSPKNQRDALCNLLLSLTPHPVAPSSHPATRHLFRQSKGR